MNATSADGCAEGSLDLNEHLVEHREATFFVRVQGESMNGAGFHDGDLLVVDRAIEAADGDMVVATADGALTLKRLSRQGGRMRLLPETPHCRPIGFAEEEELTVWGVVTSVVHRLRRDAGAGARGAARSGERLTS